MLLFDINSMYTIYIFNNITPPPYSVYLCRSLKLNENNNNIIWIINIYKRIIRIISNSYKCKFYIDISIICTYIVRERDSIIYKYLVTYSLFYKALPKSSLQMHWISVRFYEMGIVESSFLIFTKQTFKRLSISPD